MAAVAEGSAAVVAAVATAAGGQLTAVSRTHCVGENSALPTVVDAVMPGSEYVSEELQPSHQVYGETRRTAVLVGKGVAPDRVLPLQPSQSEPNRTVCLPLLLLLQVPAGV